MYRVTKRDGSITEFHIAKIANAITKAFEAVGRQYHPSVIELLALRVTAEFEPKIRHDLIAVEDIQDCVERVLSEAGYADVAKAYILYRKQREKLRNVGSTLLNYNRRSLSLELGGDAFRGFDPAFNMMDGVSCCLLYTSPSPRD